MQPAHLLSSLPLQREVSPLPPSATLNSLPPFPRWKRSLDVACSVTALPILGCTTLIAAVVASVASPGPLLFREAVRGENGRRFGMYRFRTLQNVSAETSTKQASQRTAPYVTGGRVLRRSGLVKLPQIVNVLRGEMTIVGCQPTAFSGTVESGRSLGRPGILRVTPVGNESAASSTTYHSPSFRTELRIIAQSVTGAISGILMGRDDPLPPRLLPQ